MKKYLKLLFLAIFASMSFAFVACGDDEDDEPDNNGGSGNNTTSAFVGTWEMTTSGALGYGDGEAYIRFNKDKTFVLVNDYGYDDVEVSYGTWSNTKDTFTINYEIAQGGIPIIPTVTYKIESTSSQAFKLSFGGQYFNFTKVPDSMMDRYQDEIDDML